MPKINVYLPDDLAAAVRQAGIPVSPVCQKALADAVRLVGRARATVARLRDPDFDPATFPQIGSRMESLMTPRLSHAIRLAREAAAAAPWADTRHLLIGLLDQGDNLGLHVLRALDVDAEELRHAAAGLAAYEAGPPDGGDDASFWSGLTFPARMAMASTLEASIDLGHNYLGCEHLLIGFLEVPDSAAARVLQSFGVDAAAARRAVTTAIAGVVHARAISATADTSKLDEIVRRLDAVEARLGPMGT